MCDQVSLSLPVLAAALGVLLHLAAGIWMARWTFRRAYTPDRDNSGAYVGAVFAFLLWPVPFIAWLASVGNTPESK